MSTNFSFNDEFNYIAMLPRVKPDGKLSRVKRTVNHVIKGYFPSADEHELPLSERVSEFCGLTPPSRTFLSSQNAALLQYSYPKFKTDELFAFIKEYEKHRMLYDFDHPLYTNYVERTKRFMMISKALNIEGLTAERVRAKIKVFRGNYTHRLKEMYKKLKVGEDFNAPSWWYMADRFLRPHIRFLDPDIPDVLPSSRVSQFST
ncbi:unnamed protein product [Nesidiocoris tenuis]|uniref:MADF domain-containing protein n=1 Tax=Nesidiocoris tenuis TaxID=355587 RepID=A0A6H5HK45_9HEMI|nr:unnamed protein product [Nesidiocoris tenuis]